ncbi:DgyrCDS13663 [Dimorphilus gyrociliatus]|uniref:DgyrCDS13663 n=1 Tax=Dimorphilus gyrociliatus TaxID=2664684 RepID=A0A7I8WBC3_9ANNE|nr:DgyrCDS13663 [Dimorphilus gyrociliatus]
MAYSFTSNDTYEFLVDNDSEYSLACPHIFPIHPDFLAVEGLDIVDLVNFPPFDTKRVETLNNLSLKPEDVNLWLLLSSRLPPIDYHQDDISCDPVLSINDEVMPYEPHFRIDEWVYPAPDPDPDPEPLSLVVNNKKRKANSPTVRYRITKSRDDDCEAKETATEQHILTRDANNLLKHDSSLESQPPKDRLSSVTSSERQPIIGVTVLNKQEAVQQPAAYMDSIDESEVVQSLVDVTTSVNESSLQQPNIIATIVNESSLIEPTSLSTTVNEPPMIQQPTLNLATVSESSTIQPNNVIVAHINKSPVVKSNVILATVHKNQNMPYLLNVPVVNEPFTRQANSSAMTRMNCGATIEPSIFIKEPLILPSSMIVNGIPTIQPEVNTVDEPLPNLDESKEETGAMVNKVSLSTSNESPLIESPSADPKSSEGLMNQTRSVKDSFAVYNQQYTTINERPVKIQRTLAYTAQYVEVITEELTSAKSDSELQITELPNEPNTEPNNTFSDLNNNDKESHKESDESKEFANQREYTYPLLHHEYNSKSDPTGDMQFNVENVYSLPWKQISKLIDEGKNVNIVFRFKNNVGFRRARVIRRNIAKPLGSILYIPAPSVSNNRYKLPSRPNLIDKTINMKRNGPSNSINSGFNNFYNLAEGVNNNSSGTSTEPSINVSVRSASDTQQPSTSKPLSERENTIPRPVLIDITEDTPKNSPSCNFCPYEDLSSDDDNEIVKVIKLSQENSRVNPSDQVQSQSPSNHTQVYSSNPSSNALESSALTHSYNYTNSVSNSYEEAINNQERPLDLSLNRRTGESAVVSENSKQTTLENRSSTSQSTSTELSRNANSNKLNELLNSNSVLNQPEKVANIFNHSTQNISELNNDNQLHNPRIMDVSFISRRFQSGNLPDFPDTLSKDHMALNRTPSTPQRTSSSLQINNEPKSFMVVPDNNQGGSCNQTFMANFVPPHSQIQGYDLNQNALNNYHSLGLSGNYYQSNQNNTTLESRHLSISDENGNVSYGPFTNNAYGLSQNSVVNIAYNPDRIPDCSLCVSSFNATNDCQNPLSSLRNSVAAPISNTQFASYDVQNGNIINTGLEHASGYASNIDNRNQVGLNNFEDNKSFSFFSKSQDDSRSNMSPSGDSDASTDNNGEQSFYCNLNFDPSYFPSSILKNIPVSMLNRLMSNCPITTENSATTDTQVTYSAGHNNYQCNTSGIEVTSHSTQANVQQNVVATAIATATITTITTTSTTDSSFQSDNLHFLTMERNSKDTKSTTRGKSSMKNNSGNSQVSILESILKNSPKGNRKSSLKYSQQRTPIPRSEKIGRKSSTKINPRNQNGSKRTRGTATKATPKRYSKKQAKIASTCASYPILTSTESLLDIVDRRASNATTNTSPPPFTQNYNPTAPVQTTLNKNIRNTASTSQVDYPYYGKSNLSSNINSNWIYQTGSTQTSSQQIPPCHPTKLYSQYNTPSLTSNIDTGYVQQYPVKYLMNDQNKVAVTSSNAVSYTSTISSVGSTFIESTLDSTMQPDYPQQAPKPTSSTCSRSVEQPASIPPLKWILKGTSWERVSTTDNSQSTYDTGAADRSESVKAKISVPPLESTLCKDSQKCYSNLNLTQHIKGCISSSTSQKPDSSPLDSSISETIQQSQPNSSFPQTNENFSSNINSSPIIENVVTKKSSSNPTCTKPKKSSISSICSIKPVTRTPSVKSIASDYVQENAPGLQRSEKEPIPKNNSNSNPQSTTAQSLKMVICKRNGKTYSNPGQLKSNTSTSNIERVTVAKNTANPPVKPVSRRKGRKSSRYQSEEPEGNTASNAKPNVVDPKTTVVPPLKLFICKKDGKSYLNSATLLSKNNLSSRVDSATVASSNTSLMKSNASKQTRKSTFESVESNTIDEIVNNSKVRRKVRKNSLDPAHKTKYLPNTQIPDTSASSSSCGRDITVPPVESLFLDKEKTLSQSKSLPQTDTKQLEDTASNSDNDSSDRDSTTSLFESLSKKYRNEDFSGVPLKMNYQYYLELPSDSEYYQDKNTREKKTVEDDSSSLADEYTFHNNTWQPSYTAFRPAEYPVSENNWPGPYSAKNYLQNATSQNLTSTASYSSVQKPIVSTLPAVEYNTCLQNSSYISYPQYATESQTSTTSSNPTKQCTANSPAVSLSNTNIQQNNSSDAPLRVAYPEYTKESSSFEFAQLNTPASLAVSSSNSSNQQNCPADDPPTAMYPHCAHESCTFCSSFNSVQLITPALLSEALPITTSQQKSSQDAQFEATYPIYYTLSASASSNVSTSSSVSSPYRDHGSADVPYQITYPQYTTHIQYTGQNDITSANTRSVEQSALSLAAPECYSDGNNWQSLSPDSTVATYPQNTKQSRNDSGGGRNCNSSVTESRTKQNIGIPPVETILNKDQYKLYSNMEATADYRRPIPPVESILSSRWKFSNPTTKTCISSVTSNCAERTTTTLSTAGRDLKNATKNIEHSSTGKDNMKKPFQNTQSTSSNLAVSTNTNRIQVSTSISSHNDNVQSGTATHNADESQATEDTNE